MRALNARGELTEAGLQAGILRAARQLGWLCYHSWTSIRSSAGFPDLVLVKGDRVLYAELKSATGKLTEAQAEWLVSLKAAGQEVYLVRPADYDAFLAVLQAHLQAQSRGQGGEG